jgi:hypothetical protein
MIALLLLQAAVGAAPVPVATGAERAGSDVVVSAQRLDQTEAALAACVARRCAPVADINATIAHADNQFIAGDFRGARRTLLASKGRNQGHARDFPVAVSELLRVDAFVAQLVGEDAYARIGTLDSVSALKKGLAAGDQRIAAQRLEVAAIFARQGRKSAITMLDAITDTAAERGWPKLEAEARLRAAAVYAGTATRDLTFLGEARRRLAALRAMTAPAARPYIDAAVLVDARLAQISGDKDALAVARSAAKTARVDQAIMVYTPAVDLGQAFTGGNVRPLHDTRDQWVDLRFNVAPDGSVRHLSEVGRGKRAEGRWIKVAADSVANRQYLPLAQASDGPGIERVERFLLTAALDSTVDSRIRVPVGRPRLQSVDLTPRDFSPGAALPTAG